MLGITPCYAPQPCPCYLRVHDDQDLNGFTREHGMYHVHLVGIPLVSHLIEKEANGRRAG